MEYDDRHLNFVLKYYRQGKFDTKKAIARFRNRYAEKKTVRMPVRVSAAVLAVAAAAAVVAILFRTYEAPSEIYAGDAIAEIMLPDSSKAILAPGSKISFKEKRFIADRSVRMKGKIFFEVFRNEASPFTVMTSDASVTVLGTKFQVEETSDLKYPVKVYVSEGKVLVKGKKKGKSMVMTKGMDARLTEEGDIESIAGSAGENEIAWVRKTFIFDNTPLREVLAQLSDFYNVSFYTTRSDKSLSGEFETDDLELIISIIENALDVKIEIRKNK